MGEEARDRLRQTVTEADTAPLDEWPVDPLYAPPPAPEVPADGDRGVPAVVAREARSQRVLFAAGLAVALVILLALALLWALTRDSNPQARAAKPPRPVASPTSLTVPSLVGFELGPATRALDRRGLKVEVRRSPSNRARGTVLAQSPGRGTHVAKGDSVLLVVAGPASSASTSSSTTKQASPPAGKTTTAATTTAETTTAAKTTTTPKPAGPPKVLMPKLVGLTLAGAQEQLRQRGLRSTVEKVTSTQDPGTVLAQQPVTGSQLRRGMSVTLRVAAAPTTIAVPDVTGLGEAEARSQLTDAGFEVASVDQSVTDASQDGVVVGVDPAAGSRAAHGSTVTITVGRLAAATGG